MTTPAPSNSPESGETTNDHLLLEEADYSEDSEDSDFEDSDSESEVDWDDDFEY